MRQLAILCGIALSICLHCSAASAESLCFSLAENYYEQIYCELDALGKARNLPAFADFRNNDETTQALLLKRTAARIGIEVKPPRRQQSPPRPQQEPARQMPSLPAAVEPGRDMAPALADCVVTAGRINCATESYIFVSNRTNDLLPEGMLTDANRMNLPVFTGDSADRKQTGNYLSDAYAIYLQKMISIGLAESTLSFPKFSYIFNDIVSKGASFSQRFETMYKYLKQEKQRIRVPVTGGPKEAPALSNCQRVDAVLLSCTQGRKNYLYSAVRG